MFYICNGNTSFISRVKKFLPEHKVLNLCEVVVDLAGDREELVYNNQKLELDKSDFFYIKSSKVCSFQTFCVCYILQKIGSKFTDHIHALNTEGSNKITQALYFYKKLPTLPTLIGSSKGLKANIEYIEDNFSYPFVLKKQGSKGKAVWKIDSRRYLYELLEEVGDDNEVFLVQVYVKTNADIRVVIVEGGIVATIKRQGEGFYHNVSQGADATEVVIDKKLQNYAIEAVKISGLSVAGVDILETEDKKYYLTEVNKNPDLNLFNEHLGYDLERKVVEKIFKNSQ